MTPGTIIISHSHDDAEAIEQVRAEIKAMGHTSDTVAIRKYKGGLVVVIK